MLEGYTALGFLAAHTSSVELQLLMTGVTYRHPGLLAKIVSTLDVLSGGRAALGIGAAWYEREHRALGVPFPPLAERFERLEETLQICLQMWSTDDGPFHGAHYRLEETRSVPQPISQPHPPIRVGGSGERKTLRLVAKYADAANVFGGPEAIHHKYEILARHCAEVGRDYNEIERSTLQSGNDLPSVLVDRFGDLADAGAQHVIINLHDPSRLERLETIGRDVIPQIRSF